MVSLSCFLMFSFLSLGPKASVSRYFCLCRASMWAMVRLFRFCAAQFHCVNILWKGRFFCVLHRKRRSSREEIGNCSYEISFFPGKVAVACCCWLQAFQEENHNHRDQQWIIPCQSTAQLAMLALIGFWCLWTNWIITAISDFAS